MPPTIPTLNGFLFLKHSTVNDHSADSQLKLWHSLSRHDETEVEQPTHRQVEVEPAGVVVGIQPVAQVGPARIQRCNALQLCPADKSPITG